MNSLRSRLAAAVLPSIRRDGGQIRPQRLPLGATDTAEARGESDRHESHPRLCGLQAEQLQGQDEPSAECLQRDHRRYCIERLRGFEVEILPVILRRAIGVQD